MSSLAAATAATGHGQADTVTLVVHVLLTVYWLGGDLGVFYLSFVMLRPGLGGETRRTVAGALAALDLGPRLCLVLMLPSGLQLGYETGLIPVPLWVVVLVWVASLAWLGLVLGVAHPGRGTPIAALRRLDLWLRYALVATLGGSAVVALATGRPYRTWWLAVTVGLYAVTIAFGVLIRRMMVPFGSALALVGVPGCEAEALAGLSGSMARARPWVVGIWTCIVAILGVTYGHG